MDRLGVEQLPRFLHWRFRRLIAEPEAETRLSSVVLRKSSTATATKVRILVVIEQSREMSSATVPVDLLLAGRRTAYEASSPMATWRLGGSRPRLGQPNIRKASRNVETMCRWSC